MIRIDTVCYAAPLAANHPYDARMFRRVRVIMIFLLLGAVVNVAVAWGVRFVIREDPRTVTVSLNDPTRTTLLDIVHTKEAEAEYYDYGLGFGRALFTVNRRTTFVDDYIARTSMRTNGWTPRVTAEAFNRHLRGNSPFRVELDDAQVLAPTDPRIRVEYAAGWPRRSMRYVERVSGDVTAVRSFDDAAAVLHGGLAVPARFAEARHVAIPLWPIFPGFLINTVIYAALLWLMICAPFALRRVLRRKRQLCAACAYPVGVSPVCTECGAAITPTNSREAAR